MTGPADTTREARKVHLDILRRMSGPERVAMAVEMSETARAATRAGIRYRHPHWTDEQVHDALLAVLLGRDLADRVRRARLLPV